MTNQKQGSAEVRLYWLHRCTALLCRHHPQEDVQLCWAKTILWRQKRHVLSFSSSNWNVQCHILSTTSRDSHTIWLCDFSLARWVATKGKRHLSSCNSVCHFCGAKEMHQSKPKNGKPINWKNLLIPRIKAAPNLKIGWSFKNIPSKA